MGWGEIDLIAEETLKSYRFLYSGYSFNKHSDPLCVQLASHAYRVSVLS